MQSEQLRNEMGDADYEEMMEARRSRLGLDY
jgi:hypothetical protein